MLFSSTTSGAEIIRPEKSGIRMDALNRGKKTWSLTTGTNDHRLKGKWLLEVRLGEEYKVSCTGHLIQVIIYQVLI